MTPLGNKYASQRSYRPIITPDTSVRRAGAIQCLRFRPAKSISHGNFASHQDAHAHGHDKRNIHADDAPYFNARLSRKCPEHDALTNISHSDASTIERYAND